MSQHYDRQQSTQIAQLLRISPYVQIARPDHWFKNVFMLAGVLLGVLYSPEMISPAIAWTVLLGLGSICLVASANYVINEILDAPTDLSHPVKRNRPIPAGRVWLPLAYAEWVILALSGLAIAYIIGVHFFITSAIFLLMGIVYNVPPVRTKELPYLDVVSEAVNNPLRLALGWFAVGNVAIPPMSLLLFFWMIGAFFMATKRFSEYRAIADAKRAAAYRSSFRYYDDNRLLVSMFFFATAAALFLGIFIIRYKLELILIIPLVAGFFSWYMRVALKDESAAQSPERLYRERGLVVYLIVCLVAFVAIMFVKIPLLYEWFNVKSSSLPLLWEL